MDEQKVLNPYNGILPTEAEKNAYCIILHSGHSEILENKILENAN